MTRQMGIYELGPLLGSGGMGEVYRARDTKLGRDVAIKILPAHFAADPDRRARFEREARLLATLNHPHIGAIYGLEDSEVCRLWSSSWSRARHSPIASLVARFPLERGARDRAADCGRARRGSRARESSIAI